MRFKYLLKNSQRNMLRVFNIKKVKFKKLKL